MLLRKMVELDRSGFALLGVAQSRVEVMVRFLTTSDTDDLRQKD
jgi:hypothetical protein